ncbi:MAG: GGDEF domain-containing protein [Ruminococcaceae bacterium]|nr:GGDEF domain-containing protein [Oscillospiraceae bacterium]
MGKKHSADIRILYRAVYVLVMALLIAHLLGQTDIRPFLQWEEGAVNSASDGWITGDGVTVDTRDVSANKFGGAVILRKQLPQTLSHNDSLCFASSNARITVWIDEEIVYQFNTVENLTGFGYGLAHHIVNLSPEDAGKSVRIGMVSVFSNHGGGRLRSIQICPASTYTHLFVREELVPFLLSFLIMFFGAVILAFHFGLRRKNILPYNMLALGVGTFLIGLWCMVDTGIPQLLTGSIIACRVMDYTLIHMSTYPMVCFISSLTRQKRPIYVHAAFILSSCCVLLLLGLRFFAGYDMHILIPLVYFSYFSPIAIVSVMLADNRRYCRKNNITSNLRHFYVGAAALLLGATTDIAVYLFDIDGLNGHGWFLRLGLCVFVAELMLQLLHWWSNERTSIERDRFVNRVLQYAMSGDDAETRLNATLQYLGTHLHARRAYIFEDMHDGAFDNTYEWCCEGMEPKIDQLKDVPFKDTVEVWYEEYKRSGYVLIYDVNAYHAVSENVFRVLEPQGIETLATAPLEVNGKYIGFFGVDDPPAESMKEISEIIRLLSYFLSQMLLQRDEQRQLIQYSHYDSLTGARNRRAMGEFEQKELDVAVPFGFIMCDINGLKRANDTCGHEAGDALIIDIANSLMEVFGARNVYRVGGDEFAAYAFPKDAAEFDAAVERLRALIVEKGRSASIGCVFSAGGAADLEAVKAEADVRMYVEKEQYYVGRNDRRSDRRLL